MIMDAEEFNFFSSVDMDLAAETNSSLKYEETNNQNTIKQVFLHILL